MESPLHVLMHSHPAKFLSSCSSLSKSLFSTFLVGLKEIPIQFAKTSFHLAHSRPSRLQYNKVIKDIGCQRIVKVNLFKKHGGNEFLFFFIKVPLFNFSCVGLKEIPIQFAKTSFHLAHSRPSRLQYNKVIKDIGCQRIVKVNLFKKHGGNEALMKLMAVSPTLL